MARKKEKPTRLLDNEEIKTRILEIRAEEEKSEKRRSKLNRLVIDLAWCVDSVIYKYRGFSNYEDLRQVGLMALCDAIKNYNCSLTFNFFRYAKWFIKTKVFRAIKKINLVKQSYIDLSKKENEGKEQTSLVSLDFVSNSLADGYNLESDVSMRDQVSFAVRQLPEQYQEFLCYRFGIFDTLGGYSIKELSDKYHKSPQMTQLLEKKILSRLREILE